LAEIDAKGGFFAVCQEKVRGLSFAAGVEEERDGIMYASPTLAPRSDRAASCRSFAHAFSARRCVITVDYFNQFQHLVALVGKAVVHVDELAPGVGQTVD
jgi:hypothetical protein